MSAATMARSTRLPARKQDRSLGELEPMPISSPKPKLPVVAIALLIALSLSMQAMLVSAQSADGAATFHGNPARTGEQPGPGPEGDPTLAWRFQTGDAVRSSPVMAGGVIYVGSNDGSLYALDAETGEERWRFTTDGPISGSAAVAEGVVYVASGDGYAYAVDAETGEERWRFFAAELGVDPARLPDEERDRGAVTASVAVVDGLVYVSSNSFKITAIDAATGIERWHAFSNGSDVTTPTVADGRLFFASDKGVLTIEAETGELLWQAVFESETADAADDTDAAEATATADTAEEAGDEDPTEAGEGEGEVDEAPDSRATGGFEGREVPLSAYVAANFDGFTWDISGAPVVFDDRLFVVIYGTKGSGGGEPTIVTSSLMALNLESGDVMGLWLFYAWKPILSTAAVVDGTAFVGVDQGLLYAYDVEGGVERWAVQTEHFIASSPAVAGETVFFGNDSGVIYALATGSGLERWRFETGGAVRSSPVVQGGRVYVGSDDGYVYAIGGS